MFTVCVRVYVISIACLFALFIRWRISLVILVVDSYVIHQMSPLTHYRMGPPIAGPISPGVHCSQLSKNLFCVLKDELAFVQDDLAHSLGQPPDAFSGFSVRPKCVYSQGCTLNPAGELTALLQTL